jgi:hypothetical protein
MTDELVPGCDFHKAYTAILGDIKDHATALKFMDDMMTHAETIRKSPATKLANCLLSIYSDLTRMQEETDYIFVALLPAERNMINHKLKEVTVQWGEANNKLKRKQSK